MVGYIDNSQNVVAVETGWKTTPEALTEVLMSQYIEFVADRLAVQFGCDKIYNTSNPFDFMDLISMRTKTNFFEKRVGEYGKAGVSVEDNEMELDLDADF